MDNVKEITFSRKPKSIADMDNIQDLYTSISIPSAIHSHSMAMEYMKNWFFSKFEKDYFKTIYIDDQNFMNDFKDFKINKSLKKVKPAVAIQQQIHFDFNRENLDLYQFGMNMYSRRSIFETSFFKDREKNMFLAINLDQLESTFTFKIKVSTRAQQVDLFKHMQMMFRVGSTQNDFIDMDFHIPYGLVLQIANDNGFEIKNGEIVNAIDFVKYMNSHSALPVLYKYRTINGRSEFFLRFSNMYIHISNIDPLSVDDGEKLGMISHNYIIEMNTTLRIPCPKMYMYYSTKQHKIINSPEYKKNENEIGLYSVKVTNFPEFNNKHWTVYLTTEVFEDDKSKPFSVNFNELFENNDMGKVVKYLKSMYIAPSIFLDFKMLNNSEFVDFKMDWDTMTAFCNESLTADVTSIAIYVDMEYYNEQLIHLKNMYDNKYKSLGYKNEMKE